MNAISTWTTRRLEAKSRRLKLNFHILRDYDRASYYVVGQTGERGYVPWTHWGYLGSTFEQSATALEMRTALEKAYWDAEPKP